MASTIQALSSGSGGLVSSGDASGILQIQTGSGPTTAINIDASQVVTINGLTVGKGGGSVTTNTAFGLNALSTNSTGSANTAVGDNALTSNSTGTDNSAFGLNALNKNTASYNSAFGVSSLYANTSGTFNTGYGWNSLPANTTGSYNVAVGPYSLNANTTASNNTAVGYQAGYSTTTGIRLTAIGQQAGYSNTTANHNTFIGYQAGYSSNYTSGDAFNTFVGYYSGGDITTGIKNTIIGKYSGNQGGLDIRTASNYIVLSDGDGNPRQYIDNNGTVTFPNASSSGGATIGGATYTYRITGTSGTAYFGFVSAQTQLQMSFNSTTAGVSLGSGATSWGTFSDSRLKNITGKYDNALADIGQLEPVKFTWKSDTENKPQVGVIAQSVQSVVPEAIDTCAYIKDDTTEYLQVRYTELIPLMIASIQALKAENDALTAKLKAANVAGF